MTKDALSLHAGLVAAYLPHILDPPVAKGHPTSLSTKVCQFFSLSMIILNINLLYSPTFSPQTYIKIAANSDLHRVQQELAYLADLFAQSATPADIFPTPILFSSSTNKHNWHNDQNMQIGDWHTAATSQGFTSTTKPICLGLFISPTHTYIGNPDMERHAWVGIIVKRRTENGDVVKGRNGGKDVVIWDPNVRWVAEEKMLQYPRGVTKNLLLSGPQRAFASVPGVKNVYWGGLGNETSTGRSLGWSLAFMRNMARGMWPQRIKQGCMVIDWEDMGFIRLGA